MMNFEWDARKAAANYSKHGVRFAEAVQVFTDDLALTIEETSSDGEQCFVAMGAGLNSRVIVVAFCYREENIRVISARLAEPRERDLYEDKR